MSTLADIEGAVNAIQKVGNLHTILLHCVVSYPSRPEDANLRAITTLQRAFGLPVGLSDHTQNEFTSVLAAQMGACMIEKHFTLDHALKLPDHEASLDPVQWKRLVDQVRLVPTVLGDGVKRVAATEEKWRVAARKSIVSIRSIRRGQKISADDLAIRRPSGGMPPGELSRVVGLVARDDIAAGTVLSPDMLKHG
jgi:sialic acid synthase SpsE